MITPEVLLHLGLPKTATSSLQQNVFLELHKEKKINFLGKCLNHDYKTGKTEIINYDGQFIRDAAEEKCSIDWARDRLLLSLDSERLNVFSDEGLMVAYPGKNNLSLVRKFDNLKAIFQGYNIRVVVTLRDPIDYLYSLYVELYPEYCSRVRELNSVQKYIDQLIADPSDVLFESFLYSRWLPELQERFDVIVNQYEDIVVGRNVAYQSWAGLLGIHADDFRRLFDVKRVNDKKKNGKEVQKVGDFKGVESWMRNALSSNRVMYNALKWGYNRLSLKSLLNRRFSTITTHRYPFGDQYEQLRDLLIRNTDHHFSL